MDNLEIQFNASIIKKVKSLNLQVDQIGSVLFILFCLYEGQLDLLDEFDDFNRQRRAFLLYMELEQRGLVQGDFSQEANSPHFMLTKEGIEFVEYVKGEFTMTNQIVTGETIAVAGINPEQLEGKSLDINDPMNWIDEWVDIFPRGVKSGGRLLRGDKLSCMRKMRVFLREYPGYSKEIIMQATRNYIESKRNEGFAYTRCAVYFIYRVDSSRSDKVSDLATWCDQAIHEQSEGSTSSENNLEIMV